MTAPKKDDARHEHEGPKVIEIEDEKTTSSSTDNTTEAEAQQEAKQADEAVQDVQEETEEAPEQEEGEWQKTVCCDRQEDSWQSARCDKMSY